MPHRYLLDTNILSEVIRNPSGTIAARIQAAGESTVCTSIIVAAELAYGAEKSGSKRLRLQADIVLSAMDILPLQAPVHREYARIRHQLTQSGELIGPNDLLIAAQAKLENLIVVIANHGEFSRVPGLATENWLD